MLNLLAHAVTLLEAIAADRTRLAFENVLLRQQLAVLRRSTKRPRIDDEDRVFWILVSRLVSNWAEHLVIVKPETVIRWHRKGFAAFWRRRSRARRIGRPPIPREVIDLIRRLSSDNPLWGAPRIADELALLGHEVGDTTVAKYMVRPRPGTPRIQSWRTLLANHMEVSAACDFFTVPTLTFRVLYVFVVLSHDRRRIVHVNLTRHPTAEWAAQQLIEAFPGSEEPRFLHRDRDGIYGDAFRRAVQCMGIREVLSSKRSPWPNPYVERVIGSIRRECTDHIIALGETHLLRKLNEYVAWYNESRPHQSLDGNAPEPRDVEDEGEVVSKPVLNGLHHRYRRAA